MEPLVPDRALLIQVEVFLTPENTHEVNQVLFLYLACAEISQDVAQQQNHRLLHRVRVHFELYEKTLKHFVDQKGVPTLPEKV